MHDHQFFKLLCAYKLVAKMSSCSTMAEKQNVGWVTAKFWLCGSWKAVDHSKIKEYARALDYLGQYSNLYSRKKATVGKEYEQTEWRPVGKGVRQRCILLSDMFYLYKEHTIWKAGLDIVEWWRKIGERNFKAKMLLYYWLKAVVPGSGRWKKRVQKQGLYCSSEDKYNG